MNFTELPLEIIIIIIQKLDTPSVFSMFYTCKHIRNLVAMQGVVKKCCFSRNTLAAASTFKTQFFTDIASQLHELNMSGAPDVRKTLLFPGMSRMKNLQTLDISYTNLCLYDFIDIYKVCPTIVNIKLNFMMHKHGIVILRNEVLVGCQKAFKNCRNIHFVGSETNLLHGKLPLLLLEHATLDTLKFSIAEKDRLHTMFVPHRASNSPMANFKEFSLYFLNWKTVYAFFCSFFTQPVLAMIELKKVEVIIIMRQNVKHYNVHSTPVFNKYFQDTFGIETETVHISENSDEGRGSSAIMCSNAVIMIWDKVSHTFDQDFFCKLTKRLRPYFPFGCSHDSVVPVPKTYDWFYVTPTVPDAKLEKVYLGKAKRKAPPDVTLDYDKLFESKERIQLSLVCDEFITNPITLSPTSNYLGKLTFLGLSGSIKYTSEFFKVLFANCVNLVTLSIEAPPVSPCHLPVSNYVHQCQTLKNFRLVDRGIGFSSLFTALGKCHSLENVFLTEASAAEDTDIGCPGIVIASCRHLYNLHIQAHMSETACARNEKLMNKAKTKYNKRHLNLTLHAVNGFVMDKSFYGYDQYISVFNLNPLKQENI